MTHELMMRSMLTMINNFLIIILVMMINKIRMVSKLERAFALQEKFRRRRPSPRIATTGQRLDTLCPGTPLLPSPLPSDVLPRALFVLCCYCCYYVWLLVATTLVPLLILFFSRNVLELFCVFV